MNEHATANINMKGCTLMIDCRGTRAKEEKEEKKEREKEKKRKKTKEKKCPRKDLNLRSSACKASFANHCATAHVLIGANGGNRVLQSDFLSYLSHSALLINAIAIITSSGTFSIHYTSFISVTHTLHLNYYHMQWQYKFVIQFVQQYKNLYAKFEAYL